MNFNKLFELINYLNCILRIKNNVCKLKQQYRHRSLLIMFKYSQFANFLITVYVFCISVFWLDCNKVWLNKVYITKSLYKNPSMVILWTSTDYWVRASWPCLLCLVCSSFYISSVIQNTSSSNDDLCHTSVNSGAFPLFEVK